jgi:hypothetical protein
MQANASSKNTQVGEQRARVDALIQSLTEEIGRAESRLSNCLRQEPVNPSSLCEKTPTQRVELASWLSSIAGELEVKISTIQSIIARCEL